LVFSSCKSAWRILLPSRSLRRLRRSSVKMRISSAKFFSSLKTCRSFDGLVAFVLFSALAGEDLDVDDSAFDARRAVERRIANIAGFFAEDGAEEFFLPESAWFRLGRNFADENVAGLHNRADADDAAFVEIAEGTIR